MAEDEKAPDPMKRNREAVERAMANEKLMKQVREAREIHRRREGGAPE